MSTQIAERPTEAMGQDDVALVPPKVNGSIPPLESGDRLSRAEFERRYSNHSNIKKAELIESEVYVASPVHVKKHADPHFNLITWLGTYTAMTVGVFGSDNATLRIDLENEPQPTERCNPIPMALFAAKFSPACGCQ